MISFSAALRRVCPGLPVVILLAAVALVAALFAVVAWESAHDYRKRTEAASVEAANLARAFEEHVNGLVSGMDSLMLHLRLLWAREPGLFGEEVASHLGHMGPGLVAQISVIDTQGILRFCSLGPLGGEVDLSDREHFRVHRDGTGDRLFISKPLVDRVSGRSLLQLTRRLSLADGSFAGVMVISLDPDYFVRFYDSIDVGRHGAIALVGMDRVIRARVSDMHTVNDPVGQSLPAERPFFDLDQPASGIYRVPSAVDGVLRLGAYRRVANYPLVVLVLLAEAEVFADVVARRSRLYFQATTVALVLLGSALGIAYLVRVQQRHAEALRIAYRRLRTSEKELRRLAATDMLTGVSNRRAFEARGVQEMRRTRRYNRPLAVAVLDIDLFKQVNDRHGHPVGDEVLKQLAHRCRACLRDQDMFARIGGEEFALLLPETDLAAAREVAEKVRRAVAAQPFTSDRLSIPLTVSIGVTELLATDATFDAQLVRADDALYQAKAAGRNRVVACDADACNVVEMGSNT